MRRAEWRRRADDPKGPLGWWWRGVVGSEQLWLTVVFVIAPFLIAFKVGVAWLIMPLAFVVDLVLKRLKPPDRLSPLLPDPAPERQFRAAVEYRRDGLVTGRDEMALTVVDGWLVGEGVRSHFALRSEDVALMKGRPKLARTGLLLVDGTQMEIVGVRLKGQQTLVDWRIGEERPEGEPTFPPARAHEREVARWVAWMTAGLFLMALLPSELLGLKELLGFPVACALFALGLIVTIMGNAKRHDLSVESYRAMRESAEGGLLLANPSLGLSPRPPLQNEPSGEGESVRMR